MKRLYIKCGFLDTKHLLMLPITWLNHCEVPDVILEILEKFYNAYHTPKSFLLINLVPQIIIHLQCVEMVYQKRRDRLLQARWTTEFLRRPLILQ